MALVGPGIQPGARFFLTPRGSRLSADPDNQYRNTRRELIFSDEFRRPNGALGDSWRSPNVRDFAIVAPGKVSPGRMTINSSANLSDITGTPFPADQWAQTTIVADISGGALVAGAGLQLRTAPGLVDNYYGIVIRPSLSTLYFGLLVGGSTVESFMYRSTWAVGDLIRFEAQGVWLRVFRNEALVLQWQQLTNQQSSGFPGLLYRGAASATVGPIYGPFSAGGFAPLGTTASDGILNNSGPGPGIQPRARFMFQSTPRDTSTPDAVGTPKDPLEWRSGPGVQPRARFMFQSTPRDTSAPTVALGALQGVSLGELVSAIGDLKASGALAGISLGELIATAGALTGAGALAGTATTGIATIGELLAAAASAISGVAVHTGTATGSLLGAGAVGGVSITTRTPAGSLLGAGALAGTSITGAIGTGSILGAGALAGTSIAGITATGSLLTLSSGAVTGTAYLIATATGAMVGSGALAGEAIATVTAIGSMGAAGALSGTSITTRTPIGALGSIGTLSGVSINGRAVTGELLALAPFVMERLSFGVDRQQMSFDIAADKQWFMATTQTLRFTAAQEGTQFVLGRALSGEVRRNDG